MKSAIAIDRNIDAHLSCEAANRTYTFRASLEPLTPGINIRFGELISVNPDNAVDQQTLKVTAKFFVNANLRENESPTSPDLNSSIIIWNSEHSSLVLLDDSRNQLVRFVHIKMTKTEDDLSANGRQFRFSSASNPVDFNFHPVWIPDLGLILVKERQTVGKKAGFVAFAFDSESNNIRFIGKPFGETLDEFDFIRIDWQGRLVGGKFQPGRDTKYSVIHLGTLSDSRG